MGELVPKAGVRAGDKWPDEFDPPPLGGATRAWVVGRVPDLGDRAAITDLYARSILVIAQHHDRSGALTTEEGDDALVAHALDVCGERGAARDFFEWAVASGRAGPLLAWTLERHLSWSHSPSLHGRLEELKAMAGLEPPSRPEPGTSATLWAAWQDALAGRRSAAIAALQSAAIKRTPLRLFLAGGAVDLRAHALLLETGQRRAPALLSSRPALAPSTPARSMPACRSPAATGASAQRCVRTSTCRR